MDNTLEPIEDPVFDCMVLGCSKKADSISRDGKAVCFDHYQPTEEERYMSYLSGNPYGQDA
jgi:hypothetical protein